MLVGEPSGAAFNRIDGDEARPVAAGFDDEGPEMNVGAVDVRAPGQDELRFCELLGLSAVADAQSSHQGGSSGGRADGAVETRCSQPVEEAAIHAGAVEEPHRAPVRVGKDGFGAVLAGDAGQIFGDGVERLIPSNALKASFALGAHAASRREQAVGRVDAVKILRDLPAQEAAGNRVIGIAAEPRGLAVLDGDQQRAGVGAIQGTGGVDGARGIGGHENIIAVDEKLILTRLLRYPEGSTTCFASRPPENRMASVWSQL